MGKIAVAPLVGAWIEISRYRLYRESMLSLPLWERGLKFKLEEQAMLANAVAPLVGAWIEIRNPIV